MSSRITWTKPQTGVGDCAPCNSPAIPRGMPWGAEQSPYVAYGRASNPERTPISDNTAIATRLTWLAGTGVGDAAACADIQAKLDVQVNYLNQAKAQLVTAKKGLEGALAVNDQQSAAILSAQVNELETQIAQQKAAVNSLTKLKADCLALPAACETTGECPAGQVCVEGKCVTPNTPPPPTKPTASKSGGSDWGIILLSIGAIGGIIKAFS